MGNLTSPGLIKATNDALIKIAPELNVLKLFSWDCSEQFSDYGLTVKVPIVTAQDAEEFSLKAESLNDYETGSGTITYETVQLTNQPKSTFSFVGHDLLEAPNAPYWSRCSEAAALAIKKSLSKSIGGLFTESACGGKVTMTSVTKNALAKLRKECNGRVADTVLALNPAYFADALSLFDSNVISSTDPIRNGYIGQLYGFKAVIQLSDLPEGVSGVIIPDNAVAFASRAVAVADESCYSEIGTASDENGFTLTTFRHGSPAKGQGFLNVTCLYGMKLFNGENCKVIAAS